MVEFCMPSLGADMEAGTLVEWLVKPGDKVSRGDIVAVVETQKGAIEIEIFEPGEIERLLVVPGTEVPVGTALALVRTAAEVRVGEPAPPRAPPPPAAALVPAASPPIMPGRPPPPVIPRPVAAPATPIAPTSRLRISPAARRLAQLRKVDPAKIAGSGPSGAIVLTDVEQHLAAPAKPREPARAIGLDLDAMRVAIAAAMARSKREIPHYYLAHQIDVTRCVAWLAEVNAARPPESRLLLGAATVKAVALALRRFPAFNGFYRDGKFEPSAAIHTGVAIAIRGGGLAAPAIHDTSTLALDELMTQMRDLVQRTRAGRMRGSEIADPTITISSLGERGVEELYGVIYPPQVAIVGFGKAVLRPWVVDGAIGPRSILTVTLAADHRVSDGHAGALFLAEVGNLLQAPEKI